MYKIEGGGVEWQSEKGDTQQGLTLIGIIPSGIVSTSKMCGVCVYFEERLKRRCGRVGKQYINK